MNPAQERIAQWLTGEAPSLLEAYLAAIRLLADPEAPGRAQMICHAGRDLCTGLQDLKSVSKERANPTAILREFDSAWRKEGLDALGIAESADHVSDVEQTASPELMIPRYMLLLLKRLIEEHRRADVNMQEQAARMFRASDPATLNRPEAVQPLSREWASLRTWFVRYAHFGVQQKVPDENELQLHFVALENFILGVIRTFYEGVEGLDEILDEANA